MLIFIIKSVGYELMTGLVNNIKSKVFQCQRLMPCVRDLAVLPGLSLPVPLLSASFCMRLSTEVFSMFFTNSSWTLKIIKHKKITCTHSVHSLRQHIREYIIKCICMLMQ